ncbi:terpene synthase [Ceratobasidium sp. AG-Ba]|nr:terpene synthase [Ceratobasidium sp. AG-Ba]
MPESLEITPSEYLPLPSRIYVADILGFTDQFFDIKLNPHWKEVEAESFTWFKTYGILTGRRNQALENSGIGQLGALVYPEADLLHLRPPMDFLIWLFAFDDMFDEGDLRGDVHGTHMVIDNAMDVLRNPDTAKPNSKAVTALHDVFNRMRWDASQATSDRFIRTAELYMNAILQQNVRRAAGSIPTVQEWIKLRRDVGAVQLCFAVLEYSLGLDIPDQVHSDPVIFELELAANDIIAWTNDIYSFPAEYAQGDPQSLVFVYMCNERTDLQSAVNHVEQLVRERTRQYVDAKSRLPSFGPKLDPQIARYAQGLEYWVQGSAHWTFTSPRYFGADGEKVRSTGVLDITGPM